MAATLDDVVAAVDRLRNVVGNQSPSSVISQPQIRGGNFPSSGGFSLKRLFGGSGGGGGGGTAAPFGFGVGGGKGGGAGGGAAGVAAGAVAIGAAMAQAAEKVKDFAKAQEDVARRLAQFSPSQAATIAGLDANRALRDLNTGEETSGTSQKLADSINSFEETIQPLIVVITDLKNIIAGAAMDVLTELAGWIKKLINAIIDAVNALKWWGEPLKRLGEDAQVNNGGFGDFLGRIATEEERKKRAAEARINAARKINDKGLMN